MTSSNNCPDDQRRPPTYSDKPVLIQLEMETLMDEMKCSFCKNVVPAPLKWACTEGHIICTDCSGIVPRCPYEPVGSKDARNMCRQNFVETGLLLYDRVYNAARFECPFKKFGCAFEPEGATIKEHCAECAFRPSSK